MTQHTIQPSVSITLIICGTAMAGMPALLYKIGAPLQDGGFLLIFGLATTMIAIGIFGGYRPASQPEERGFEPVMLKPTANLTEFVSMIASQLGATEAAAFVVKLDFFADDGIDLLLHIRDDNSDPATRETAVSAFRDLVSNCLHAAKDGVIEIQPTTQGQSPQYCLVTLAQRDHKVTGAAAFIVRCRSEQEAHVALKRLQYIHSGF